MTFLLQNFTVEIVGAAKQYQQSNTAIFFRVFSVFRGKKNLNLRKNRPTGDRLEFTTAMSAANGLSASSADKTSSLFPTSLIHYNSNAKLKSLDWIQADLPILDKLIRNSETNPF